MSVNLQSCFLPGTKQQVAWDSTSLGYLKTCPRLYQYIMIDGWGHPGESIHLRFGSEYHSALQDYELRRASGVAHEAAIQDAVSALMQRTYGWIVDPEHKAAKYKNRESLVGLVVDYLDHYGQDDPAETYILDSGKPAVELSFRFELDFGPAAGETFKEIDGFRDTPFDGVVEVNTAQPYLLCGHLDRVVNFNGALMVMDHKTTTTTLGKSFFSQWEPNNQMTLYTLAGKIVLDAPIRGVVISGAQLKLTEPNSFVRGFTHRTQDQLDEWLVDLSVLLRTAEAYAAAEYWPMNDTSCDKFGGCRFREICSKSPQVRDAFLKTDFTKLEEDEKWNPLKSR